MSTLQKIGTALAFSLALPLFVVAQPAMQREPARQVGTVDGQELYQAYCAVCHGTDGKGGGPAAPALKVPMPDLTTISLRNGGVFPSADVAAAVTGQGRSMVLSHGTADMPIWGPIFRSMAFDEGIAKLRVANLVKHIESLQQKE